MWFPSLSCQLLTFPPTKRRDSNISTSCPASARSMAATMPASPQPTTAILSFDLLFTPGPCCARCIKFSLRNASLPTCSAACRGRTSGAALRDGRRAVSGVPGRVAACCGRKACDPRWPSATTTRSAAAEEGTPPRMVLTLY